MENFKGHEITIRHQGEEVDFHQLNTDCGTIIQSLRKEMYDRWLPVIECITNAQFFEESEMNNTVIRIKEREAYTHEMQALLTKISSAPATKLGVNNTQELGENLGEILQRNAEIIRIRNIMLEHQWFMTLSFCAKWRNFSPLDQSEVQSEAQIGIMRAAEKFKPSTENSFSTYAHECMQSAAASAKRKKKAQRRKEISLETPKGRDRKRKLGDDLAVKCANPDDQLLHSSELDRAWEIINNMELDSYELKLVQMLYIGTERISLQEMAASLQLTPSNTGDRIRRLEVKIRNATQQRSGTLEKSGQ